MLVYILYGSIGLDFIPNKENDNAMPKYKVIIYDASSYNLNYKYDCVRFKGIVPMKQHNESQQSCKLGLN